MEALTTSTATGKLIQLPTGIIIDQERAALLHSMAKGGAHTESAAMRSLLRYGLVARTWVINGQVRLQMTTQGRAAYLAILRGGLLK